MRIVAISGLTLPDGIERTDGKFTIRGDGDKVKDRIVMAEVVGDNLNFFPERSAGQREILGLLGIS